MNSKAINIDKRHVCAVCRKKRYQSSMVSDVWHFYSTPHKVEGYRIWVCTVGGSNSSISCMHELRLLKEKSIAHLNRIVRSGATIELS